MREDKEIDKETEEPINDDDCCGKGCGCHEEN